MLKYQLLPDLSSNDYSVLKNDIAERGVIVPIELDEGGNVLDGHHRIKAWQELIDEGVSLPDYPRVVRAGMTEEQKRNHVRALNIIRRQLTPEQRNEQMVAMRADGMTYEAIAKAVGVNASTAQRSVIANAKTQPSHVIGKDDKKYPAKKKRKKKTEPNLPKAPQLSIYAGSDAAEEKAKVKAQKKLESGVQFSVEYKADSRAAKTDNAFIETISVDTDNKPGWAKTSLAQYLIYYVPPLKRVYIIEMVDVKQSLRKWTKLYPEESAPNEGYLTWGLLVPLTEIGEIAQKVFDL